MIMKLVLLAFISNPFATSAQENTQVIVEKFFNTYQSDPSAAIDYIFSTNEWMRDSKEQIENVKTQLNSTLKIIGSYKGNNTISTKKIANEHLIKVVVLVRHERQPLRFNFTLYKADDKWAIYNFSFDDSLDEEFD